VNSMTGYGSGSASGKNFSLELELQSYNHRFLDIQIKIPPEFIEFEKHIVSTISSRVKRGRVNVFVSFKLGTSRTAVALDGDLAGKYWLALKRLRRRLKLEAEFPAASLLELPGVVRLDPVRPSAREFKKCLAAALTIALHKMLEMRKKEGDKLHSDLKKHLRALKKNLNRAKSRIEGRKPARKKLRPGRAEPGVEVNVREEIDRLESHIAQFEDALDKLSPAGKILEFITREIMRETTTLADKAGDSFVSQRAVYMKLELENLREQIRNVE
jgi:uncharacterized protein YicC (UPF0701 family)